MLTQSYARGVGEWSEDEGGYIRGKRNLSSVSC